MKKIKCTIEGVAPLLQHKMTLETEAQLDSKLKKRAGQAKGDNPEDFLYKFGGKIVQPAEHILQALIKRMGNYKIQGRGKKSYKEMASGSLNVVPEFVPHKFQKWTTDVRTVVVPSTKGRIVRKRPRLNKWELSFEIQIINHEMPVEVVKSALDEAGNEGGIGDYRPRFGRFIVTEFKEV